MRKIKKQSSAEKKQNAQELEGIVHAVTAFYERHRKHARTVLAAALSLLVAVGGYSLYHARSEGKASALLAPALELYGSANPDLEKARGLFQDIGKEYPRTLSGSIARYYEGNCLAGLGRMQESVDRYREVIEGSASDDILKGMAYQRMGFAYQSMGNTDEAIKAFEKAESLKVPGVATMELARLFERSGKTEESQKKYQTIADSLPGTSLAEEAKKKIKGAESSDQQGVKKPVDNADHR